MTRYTVTWLQDSVNELGEIWLASKDRSDVTAASAVIDRELANDAPTKGTPLAEGLRVYDAPPIRAVFSVNDSDRTVEVARKVKRVHFGLGRVMPPSDVTPRL